MGFLDKAKKVAEQAQAKLDEAQKQFHAAQGGGTSDDDAPAVESDEHGRPVPQAPPDTATPPQGDPLAGATPAARTGGPVPDPRAPAASDAPSPAADAPAPASDAPAPHGDRPPAPPLDGPGPPAGGSGAPSGADRDAGSGVPEDRNHPSYAPPKLTSGDPLQG